MRRLAQFCAALAAVVIFPTAVFAQASIAGIVRDTSGAVLPGVSVEAASPALIEKVRSVTTDGTGQFRIIDLRPGVYTVTFTLAGFNTVRREGIELSGSATFQVNADMRVGALEETVTVTGQAPVVDVQNVKTQAVLSAEVLRAVPTSRNYQNLYVLVPGVTIAAGNQDVGGAAGDQQIFFSAHGGEVRDSRTQINGLNVGDPQVGGGRSMYVPHAGSSEEVSVTTSGGLGESESAGVVVNIVPRDGGNAFSGMLFGTAAAGSMISSNYDDRLKGLGLRAPNKAKKVFDYEGVLGGPLFKDKLWFMFNARYNGASNYIAGMFENKAAGDPTKWLYEPDLSKQVIADQFWRGASLRLTWQATQRNKFSIFYEDQFRCVGCNNNGSATSTPEASGRAPSHPNNVGQLTWTSPLTDRVLLEAGAGMRQLRYGQEPFPGQYNKELIRVTEQGGIIPGLVYRAPGTQINKNWLASYPSRASLSYVTGANSMKVGYNGTFYVQTSAQGSYTGLAYRFRDGIPNQVTVSAHPLAYRTHANQWGLFAQDQFTMGRLTVAGGVRYDRYTTHYPASQLGPVRWLPKELKFPEQDGFSLHDLTPRANANFNVFGDGKTALKVSLGKYVLNQDSNGSPFGPGPGAPLARLATATSRSWNDANRNFVPDCDLLNLAANAECGAASDLNFGTPKFNTEFDSELEGWGVRPYNWEFSLGVQRQIGSRVGVSASYFRRWFGNFIVTDNRAVTAADFTSFNLPLPADSRLPQSGTVNGFVNVVPAKFGLVDNYVTAAKNFGEQTQQWNGVDLNVSARLATVLFQGGVSTGRENRNNCEVAQKLPELLGSSPVQYCDSTTGLATQVRVLGAYTIPRVAVQVAATLQNIPGQEMQASYAATNAIVAPLLGRNLAGNAANITLSLLEPSTAFSDRVNQLDVRMAKFFKLGTERRIQVSLDLFNALNSNTIQTYNTSFTPNGGWRSPLVVLPPRVAKISAQLDF